MAAFVLAQVFVERRTRDLLLALGIGSLFNHHDTPNVRPLYLCC